MEDCIDLTEEAGAYLDNEFESNLIEAVKQQPCLYVKTHPQYEGKLYNDIAWLRVSKAVNKPTINCMNKWYSLLQTFLYFSRLETNKEADEIKWPHYKVFKELQPQIIDKYVELLHSDGKNVNVTSLQLTNLFKLMEENSKKLMSVFISNAERQEIWADIAAELNAGEDGAPLPIIRWQKVWWNLKQELRRKIEEKGLSAITPPQAEARDLLILKICSVTPSNEEQVIDCMDSYIEFDVDTDRLICKKCIALQNETNSNKFCEKCSEASTVSCSICSRAPFSNACDITNWSSAAKEMIPLALRNESKLSMCQICYTTLKRKASLAWKICRVCAKETKNLDNILVSSFQDLRDEFRMATKFTFCITDGLPCYICSKCLRRVVDFNFFYTNFMSAQTVLRDIHKTHFIGEVVKKEPLKPSKNISNKRSISVPETSNKTEEAAPIPNKRKRLTKPTTPTVTKKENPEATSVLVNKDSSSPENKKHKTDRSSKPQIILNPTICYTTDLTKPKLSRIKTSVLWTCAPIQANSTSDSPASAKDGSTSELVPDSNESPASSNPSAIDIKALPNAETEDNKPNLPIVPEISSGNPQSVTSSRGVTIRKISSEKSDDNSFNKPNRDKHRILIKRVPISNKPNTATPSVLPSISSNLSQTSLPSDVQVDRENVKIKTENEQPNISTVIPSSTPLGTSALNPFLQSLLNRPSLEVTVSPVPDVKSSQISKSSSSAGQFTSVRLPTKPSIAHITCVQMPITSSSQISMPQTSTEKYVEIKKSTKDNESTRQSLNDSTIKETARKLPTRKTNMHHLSSTKSANRPQVASLEGEVIVIRDDTPPREVQPPKNEIESDYFKGVHLTTDTTLNEAEKIEADLKGGGQLKIANRSVLIGISKPFKRVTPTPKMSG